MMPWLIMSLCTIVVIIMWFIYGRDKKTIATITVSPPGGLDPLEMEYAQIANITDRGIFAMLLYWVSKGYLQVLDGEDRTSHDGEGQTSSSGEDRTSPDGEGKIGMRKAADLPEGSPDHASFMFERLFPREDYFWFNQFPEELADNKVELAGKVGERFTGKNKVVEDDSMVKTLTAMAILAAAIFVVQVMVGDRVFLPLFLAVLLIVVLAFLQNGAMGFQSKYDRFEVLVGGIGTLAILAADLFIIYRTGIGPGFIVFFLICFLICVPCILFMERRVNHRLYGQILGFRQFIETAEWDRLKQLSEEDPNYGMDILPYAMLFNMGTKWTKNFENDTITSAVEEMEKMAESEKK